MGNHNIQLAVGNIQPAVGNIQPAVGNNQPPICQLINFKAL